LEIVFNLGLTTIESVEMIVAKIVSQKTLLLET